MNTAKGMASPARWFVALRPDPAARDRLARIARQLATHTRGRATPAEKIHLTLLFIGEAPRASESDLAALVRTLPEGAPVALEQIGGFDDRLLWIGPARCPDWLRQMSDSVRQGLDALGIAYDRKRFVPHLTLVRGARSPYPAAATLTQHGVVIVERWRAHLVESVLDHRGSRYRWVNP